MSEFQLDETSRKQRRTAISQHTRLTGLDFIEVNFKPLRLLLHFIPAAQGIEKTVVPANIKPENIKITSGLSTTPLNFNLSDVEHQVGSSVLRIDLMNASPSDPNAADSSSLYTLELVNVPNLDRFFSQATFSLETDRISEFDSVSGN
jgi:hypothetical protein